MTLFYERDGLAIYNGNCLHVMAKMEANSIDTIIADSPYGLEFMGKDWDKLEGAGIEETRDSAGGFLRNGKSGSNPYAAARIRHGKDKRAMQEWHYNWAIEALRVAKPGAILLAFGGTRTHHRLMCAIEDAGWVIRDCIMWVYGSGFPKSHSISKALDKMAGVEREVVGKSNRCVGPSQEGRSGIGTFKETNWADSNLITAPTTPAAQLWGGYGTALKPAWEPIIVAMKPLDGTFAQNALKWGVAGLWVDGGRIEGNVPRTVQGKHLAGYIYGNLDYIAGREFEPHTAGRWPANLIHDGSDEVVELFPNTGKSGVAVRKMGAGGGTLCAKLAPSENVGYYDQGSAARFFYCVKASRSERNAGCEGLPSRMPGSDTLTAGIERKNAKRRPERKSKNTLQNHHPTVKPIALMRYLCRLTRTPTGGIVLDPFVGSGSTGVACVYTDRDFIGIEIDVDYCEIAKRRIDAALDKPKQRAFELGEPHPSAVTT